MIACCKELSDTVSSENDPIEYISKFREYCVNIADYFEPFEEFYFYGSTLQSISFCPFCGTKLPKSLRNKWFSSMDKLKIDASHEHLIPEEFRDDEWWKNRGY